MTDDRDMTGQDWLAQQFEAQRGHLRAVAYRLLGSMPEADDAVQEGWLRLSRSDAEAIEDLQAWLTTVVARISLNMLRSRANRREASLDAAEAQPHLPDPVVRPRDDPEQAAVLADSVGLALLVVLDALTPAERLALVLHDVFGLRFEEIAPIVGRSTVATRQLASRARRRVRGAPVPDTAIDGQWAVFEAFLAAARDGDFGRLLATLDPDVELQSDGGAARPDFTLRLRGAQPVAARAMSFRRFADRSSRVLVNGTPGAVAWTPDRRPFALLAMTTRGGRIVAIDILADPERLASLGLEAMR